MKFTSNFLGLWLTQHGRHVREMANNGWKGFSRDCGHCQLGSPRTAWPHPFESKLLHSHFEVHFWLTVRNSPTTQGQRRAYFSSSVKLRHSAAGQHGDFVGLAEVTVGVPAL